MSDADAERADLSVRDPLDADMLVWELLDRMDFKAHGFPNVHVQAEVTPVTDSLLLDGDVILYHCGAPEQPDWNLRAWVWRFTLDLTVLGPDPVRLHRLCAFLNHRIAAWPYEPATAYGKVGRLVSNPGFQRVSSGDRATSKSVTARTSVKLVQAASPID